LLIDDQRVGQPLIAGLNLRGQLVGETMQGRRIDAAMACRMGIAGDQSK
jgi:hypothetical protein